MEVISAYPFSGSEQILDVGSGDGALSALLAKKVPQGGVLGIDVSPAMVEYAKNSWSRSNLQFEEIDIKSGTFNKQFDIITIFFAFEWLVNKMMVIEKCYESLVSGGCLWILTPVNIPKAIADAILFVMENPKWQSYFDQFQLPMTYLSLKETETLLTNAKFSVYLQRIRKKQILFPSREIFHKTLVAATPCINGMSEELKEAFVSDCIDQYVLLSPIDKHGRILCPFEIAHYIAVKRGDALHQ